MRIGFQICELLLLQVSKTKRSIYDSLTVIKSLIDFLISYRYLIDLKVYPEYKKHAPRS